MQRIETGEDQSHKSEHHALGLGEDDRAQQEPRGQPSGESQPGPEEQRQTRAIEARQRQVAVSAACAARRIERRKRQQGGGQDRPDRGNPARQCPRTPIDHQQPGGEKGGIQGSECGMVPIRSRHLLHRHLRHRQQQGVPGMGHVPSPPGEHGGLDRPLETHVTRVVAPGHPAVPIPNGIGEGFAEDRERDQGADCGHGPFEDPHPRLSSSAPPAKTLTPAPLPTSPTPSPGEGYPAGAVWLFSLFSRGGGLGGVGRRGPG
jgi:hypothetical protein